MNIYIQYAGHMTGYGNMGPHNNQHGCKYRWQEPMVVADSKIEWMAYDLRHMQVE